MNPSTYSLVNLRIKQEEELMEYLDKKGEKPK